MFALKRRMYVRLPSTFEKLKSHLCQRLPSDRTSSYIRSLFNIRMLHHLSIFVMRHGRVCLGTHLVFIDTVQQRMIRRKDRTDGSNYRTDRFRERRRIALCILERWTTCCICQAASVRLAVGDFGFARVGRGMRVDSVVVRGFGEGYGTHEGFVGCVVFGMVWWEDRGACAYDWADLSGRHDEGLLV